MKEAYLTEDGILYEKVKIVYLSEDKKYFHEKIEVVEIYEKVKIKDIDKLIPAEYIFKKEKFIEPFINKRNLTIEYKSEEDENKAVEFEIDINFNKDSIKNGKPNFYKYDKEIGMFIEIFEEEIENLL